MSKLSPEDYSRIRARLEDGHAVVGGQPHVNVIDWDLAFKILSQRNREIILMSIRGFSNVTIATRFRLSRSRVSEIISEFFKGNGE